MGMDAGLTDALVGAVAKVIVDGSDSEETASSVGGTCGASEQKQRKVIRMPSGAGHDAVAMASVVPVAMLFVRCREGISHRPDEYAHPDDVAAAAEAAKNEAQRTGGVTGLSGVANLLPTSVVTSTARAAASRIDFATSNLRGAPFPIFISGSEVLATIPMGPVAGTGANITALSMNGEFDIGIFADPEAITDPESFRLDVEAAFADIDRAVTVHPPQRMTLGSALNYALRMTDARFVAKFDDDDLYGPGFLADSLRAHGYAGAGVVGKHSYFARLAATDATHLR
ncbi:MAG: M20/M25/M40 family metallo-hydrolase, partial [Ilumatobacter sp.]|nr:M20/M25/M40 family metallo-hydrolase [Ilumatobacter sp.]